MITGNEEINAHFKNAVNKEKDKCVRRFRSGTAPGHVLSPKRAKAGNNGPNEEPKNRRIRQGSQPPPKPPEEEVLARYRQ